MIQLTQVLKITNVKVGYGPGTGTGIPESLVQHTFLRHIFDSVSYLNYIWQGYTNPGLQFVVTTVLCTVAPNICRSSVWNLPHVTLPALRIFRWLLHFRKFAHPWYMVYSTTLSVSQVTPVTSNSKLLNGREHLLNLWSGVLLEKLTGSQLVKKFTALYGTRRFISAFTSARHLSLSWARIIQSMSPHPTSLRSNLILSSHLRLGLASGSSPQVGRLHSL